MARLQDFQTVTPTSSDKLLVVQSQGQGLVPYGSKLDSANPTGTGSLSLNRKANTSTGTESVAVGHGCTASGLYSFAEGETTTATGEAAHAEGYNNTASGTASHVEGSGNTASGNRGHAEGLSTTASGAYSHAEGNDSTAEGNISHAQGMNTKASRRSQFVFGECNIIDTGGADATARGTYVEIVGNGSSGANRSNARTLDWSGNEVLAGDCTIKGNKSVNDAISVSNITVTAGQTYISIIVNNSFRVGKVVFVNCTFRTSQTITGTNTIIEISDVSSAKRADCLISKLGSSDVFGIGYMNSNDNAIKRNEGNLVAGDYLINFAFAIA